MPTTRTSLLSGRWLFLLPIGAIALSAWFLSGGERDRKPSENAHSTTIGAPIPSESSPETSPHLKPASSDRRSLTQENPPAEGFEEFDAAYLSQAARKDPRLALKETSEQTMSSEAKYSALVSVANNLAISDPVEAWNWALNQSRTFDVPGKPPLLSVVMDKLATIDPGMVVANVQSTLTNNQIPDGVSLSYFAAQALLKSPRFAEVRAAIDEWAGPSPPSAPLEGMSELTPNSPEEIGAWLRVLPSSPGQNIAAGTFADTWAKTDPQAAVHWSTMLGAGHGREEALGKSMRRWLDSDLPTAKQWLDNNLSEMRASDASVETFIAGLLQEPAITDENPRQLMTWVKLISDPKLHNESLERVVLAWGKKDPTAASQFIHSNSEVLPDRKQQLLALIGAE